MKKWLSLAAAVGLLIGGAVAAVGQGNFTPSAPKVQSIGPTDLFQDVVGGQPQAGNYYAPATLLGNYSASLAGNNPENALIGGDATTNLFQRATTGASVTATVTYGGPDRWAYWSGTATAMTVSRDTTAADVPSNYQASFKMARTSGQTGILPVCMAQEVESVNVFGFQGQTAEIDFHAIPGANFSAASGAVVAYLISGTSTDEGMQKLAWGLNAGGGGSTAWTGVVNTGVTVNVTGSARYTVAIPVPAGATELGVAICYTPVGTAGTNDYVTLSGIQLVRNSGLSSIAGTAGAALLPNSTAAKAFSRRPQGIETILQERYFYNISEAANTSAFASCWNSAVTDSQCLIQFPVQMRIAPVFTGDGGLTAGFAVMTTVAGGTLGACSALAVSTNVASTVATPTSILLDCTATTVPAAGTANMLYNHSSTGRIKASAEF